MKRCKVTFGVQYILIAYLIIIFRIFDLFFLSIQIQSFLLSYFEHIKIFHVQVIILNAMMFECISQLSSNTKHLYIHNDSFFNTFYRVATRQFFINFYSLCPCGMLVAHSTNSLATLRAITLLFLYKSFFCFFFLCVNFSLLTCVDSYIFFFLGASEVNYLKRAADLVL